MRNIHPKGKLDTTSITKHTKNINDMIAKNLKKNASTYTSKLSKNILVGS